MESYVKEALELRYITPSTLPATVGFFFVDKMEDNCTGVSITEA